MLKYNYLCVARCAGFLLVGRVQHLNIVTTHGTVNCLGGRLVSAFDLVSRSFRFKFHARQRFFYVCLSSNVVILFGNITFLLHFPNSLEKELDNVQIYKLICDYILFLLLSH